MDLKLRMFLPVGFLFCLVPSCIYAFFVGQTYYGILLLAACGMGVAYFIDLLNFYWEDFDY